jgi:O-antigen/teichoic acid export membrane protein
MALVAATIWLAAIVMAAHKAWGPILIGDLRKNFGRVAKKQLRYGMQIYVGGLVSFFYEPFTKILLSHFIGIQSVAFFDIALKIRNQVWGFVSKILQPLYPLLSQLSDRVRLRMIIHDLEQKTFLLIIPALPIIVFCTRPLISLWMRENVGIITVSVIFILSAYVLAITVIPNYQFLLAKGHAEKTIVIQGSNVVFNALFFFLTYRWIGYYAVIVGNIAAILSSYALTLYYQKKYLDSLIFESFAQARKVFLTLGIDLLVAYATSSLLDSNMATLLSVPVAVIVSTVLMYRYFGLITATDIQRYSGSNDTLNHWGLKILCRT